jgi:DNA-binding XRE family transcriptional regulator
MQTPTRKLRTTLPEWAAKIIGLRDQLKLSQTAFGQCLNSSAMSISRWERGSQEPTAQSYIELGNLGGDPLCWFFWARAGLRNEDLMRVLPAWRDRVHATNVVRIQVARAGGGHKKAKGTQLVAIPVLKCVVSSNGEKETSNSILQGAPIESMIAAPNHWCPNPSTTFCLRVRGDSMGPLIRDGYILVVDSSQNDPAKLDGECVIAWQRNKGMVVSRLKRYGPTEVLQPENEDYKSIVLNSAERWKIMAKVLWWIGKLP